jgi:DNA-binding NarL/FixJ family response regulator
LLLIATGCACWQYDDQRSGLMSARPTIHESRSRAMQQRIDGTRPGPGLACERGRPHSRRCLNRSRAAADNGQMDVSRDASVARSDDLPQSEISVLVVEDDAMVREWIESALRGTEFRLAGIASTAADGVELAVRSAPQLVLTDYRLPDRAGTELVRELRLRGIRAPVIVMTANEERGLNELARDAGAQGTVLKGGVADLLEALRAVSDGEHVFDVRHPTRTTGQVTLSPRERAVLQLIAAGQTNAEIAIALGVSLKTVKSLVDQVFRKLGADHRADAVASAHALGLL